MLIGLKIVPDFRSRDTGLYNNLARLNLPYAEAVFDISYFRQHPEPFYMLAKELYPGKFYPTVSHAFVALLASKGLLEMLFTQNIDCLERRAGVPSEKIIEAHGSFATQRCIECSEEYPDRHMKDHVTRGEVPHCRNATCGGLVKPDIVFFGEALPETFKRNTFHVSMADLVIIMGTSLSVYPFASLPEMAMEGRPRLLVNNERVGSIGARADDVLEIGSCDDGVRRLAKELGWTEELESFWRDTVGEEEADRQTRSQEKVHDEVEDEVTKLTENMGKKLKFDEEDDTKWQKATQRMAKVMDEHLGPKLQAKATEEQSKDKVGGAATEEPDSSSLVGDDAMTKSEVGVESQPRKPDERNLLEDLVARDDETSEKRVETEADAATKI